MTSPIGVIKAVAVTDAILHDTDVPEDDYPEYSPTETYDEGERVIVLSSHKVYESLQGTNLGKTPGVDLTWWGEVSTTNRWKMLDLSSTTQTVFGTSAFYEFKPGRAVSAVGFINFRGISNARVRLVDPLFGTVYDRTVSLTAIPTLSSWYAWFFEPRTNLLQLTLMDLPSYPNATLRIDFTAFSTGSLGTLVFGISRTFGLGAQYGARLGIQDFSRKERNEWGDTILVQRAFAKRMSLTTEIPNSQLDNVFTLLAELRATPCLWIGTDEFQSFNIFGFYNNFEIGVQYSDYSELSIDIEGLT